MKPGFPGHEVRVGTETRDACKEKVVSYVVSCLFLWRRAVLSDSTSGHKKFIRFLYLRHFDLFCCRSLGDSFVEYLTLLS